MAVPDFVKKEIQKLSNELDVSSRELVQQYKEIYGEDFIQDDEQLETTEDKHKYALRILNIEARSGPSGNEAELVPIGYQEERKTSSGNMQSRVFCDVEGEVKELVCKEKRAKLYKDVELFHRYETVVNEYEGTFFSTSGTTFEGGEPVEGEPLEYLKEEVNIPKITVKETVKNLSKTQKDSDYIDQTDWKIIEGLVIRANKGERQDGTEWGMYIIGDESVPTETITSDGKVVPRQFTVWLPPSLMKYGKRSEIAVAGTVVANNGEPQMNAYSVLPAGRVRPREVE